MRTSAPAQRKQAALRAALVVSLIGLQASSGMVLWCLVSDVDAANTEVFSRAGGGLILPFVTLTLILSAALTRSQPNRRDR